VRSPVLTIRAQELMWNHLVSLYLFIGYLPGDFVVVSASQSEDQIWMAKVAQ